LVGFEYSQDGFAKQVNQSGPRLDKIELNGLYPMDYLLISQVSSATEKNPKYCKKTGENSKNPL
jgi:hypothetical protein